MSEQAIDSVIEHMQDPSFTLSITRCYQMDIIHHLADLQNTQQEVADLSESTNDPTMIQNIATFNEFVSKHMGAVNRALYRQTPKDDRYMNISDTYLFEERDQLSLDSTPSL